MCLTASRATVRLRQALVVQLVHDASLFASLPWIEDEHASRELATIEDFHKSLAYAFCVSFYTTLPGTLAVRIDEHLVKE